MNWRKDRASFSWLLENKKDSEWPWKVEILAVPIFWIGKAISSKDHAAPFIGNQIWKNTWISRKMICDSGIWIPRRIRGRCNRHVGHFMSYYFTGGMKPVIALKSRVSTFAIFYIKWASYRGSIITVFRRRESFLALLVGGDGLRIWARMKLLLPRPRSRDGQDSVTSTSADYGFEPCVTGDTNLASNWRRRGRSS